MEISEGAKFLAVVLAICVAWFLCVLVHELGHAAVGVLCGFRLVGFEVGPVKLSRIGEGAGLNGWRVRWSGTRWMLGLARVRASRIDLSGLGVRYTAFICGGVAANVAFAAALRFLDFGMPEKASTARGWLIFVSMLMAIMNLIPAKGKRLDSDGMVLLKMLFRRSYRQEIHARLTFIERLRMFKACFAAGDIVQAEEQLVWMRRACVSQREAKLKAIVDHLGEHVLSGESLEQCTWSPG